MKNTIRVLSIATLVLVIALSSCGNPTSGGGGGGGGGGGDNPPPAQTSNGTFTLTDIPAQYNGKWAAFVTEDFSDLSKTVFGCQGFNTSTKIITLAPISNGSVSVPIWFGDLTGGEEPFLMGMVRYSGNRTYADSAIIIYDGSQMNISLGLIPQRIVAYCFDSVAFSNGSAARSVNNADNVIDYL